MKLNEREIVAGILIGVIVFLMILGYGSTLLPLAFLAGLLYFVFHAAGIRSLQKKYRTSTGLRPSRSTTFDDVGGQEPAKKELVEALDFLTREEAVRRLGIRPLKGILLSGPPGTGKTLLAKAAAGYTNSSFLAASGSEFIEMYAGVGAQRVRELFSGARERAKREARKNAIIFIDEIEVLGGKRGRHASHLEYDQTLNQLLVEMDGISANDEIRLLLIGATNREDLLDEALLRPGRFDRIVRVHLPDRVGREYILSLHTRNKPLSPDVDIGIIARETFGFSGAHLESLANEAAILAMRNGRREISQNDFLEAIDKVMLGEKLDRKPDREELRRVAIHEAGHALVSECLRPGSVASITISPRGNALGYVRNSPKSDQYLYTQHQLEEEICICLAGLMAEELILGSRSTGAANDLEKAVHFAESLILTGMSSLGVVSGKSLPERTFDRTIRSLMKEMEQRVRGILEKHKSILIPVAEDLFQNESFPGANLRARLESFKQGDPQAAGSGQAPAGDA